MIRVDIKINGAINRELDKIKRDLKAYPAEALTEFKRLTPIARINGGNARRRTTLRNNAIEAEYPYAQRLDQGWSKQAPKGMTEPFGKWLERKVKQIFGK
jgi:hypothetical protein